MQHTTYLKAIDIIEDVDGFAQISDLGINVNGTQVDVIKLKNTWDGDLVFKFYAGDPTNDNDEWEELILTDEEQEQVLKQFIVLF